MDITHQEKYGEDYDLGYRFDERALGVGDAVPSSYQWDGDETTDEQLPGACCFDTLAAAREYARWNKGRIILIGGERVGCGQEPGEDIMADAVVLEIVETIG